VAAGLAAGTINTVVGSGTLITFPVLLAFGYAPVTANVTNTLGLVPGSAAGAYGYREELRGQWRRTGRLACASVTGGVVGAILLLSLPASAFKAIVPVFIGVVFVFVAHIAWDAAALIALGAVCGGVVGARFGRRLPPEVLRGVIVVVGISAILQLLLR
jgi:uncharacterized membrane protein YfcA